MNLLFFDGCYKDTIIETQVQSSCCVIFVLLLHCLLNRSNVIKSKVYFRIVLKHLQKAKPSGVAHIWNKL